jgi:hypothetical protein
LICEALHEVTVPTVIAPKRTKLEPCVVPKLLPLIVTALPGSTVVGETLAIAGAGVTAVTVKVTALVEPPPVTSTVTGVAPVATFGTVATI